MLRKLVIAITWAARQTQTRPALSIPREQYTTSAATGNQSLDQGEDNRKGCILQSAAGKLNQPLTLRSADNECVAREVVPTGKLEAAFGVIRLVYRDRQE